ncbi:prepilin-type N-terminal cleavage/methylation domain-containing protein [Planctomycetota bacterium]
MRRKRNNGFTLIEVLAATVILSGTILGFIRIMGDNLSVSRQTELRLTSTLLAEGEVERIKAALFDDFATDVSAWSTDLGNDYRASRTVTSVSTYLKRIAVEVGYDTDGDSSLDSGEVLLTLTTQYADH